MNQMRIYLLQEEPFLTYAMPAEDLVEYEKERAFYQSLVHKERQQEQAQQTSLTNRTLRQRVVRRFWDWFQNKPKSNDASSVPETTVPRLTDVEQNNYFLADFIPLAPTQQNVDVPIFDWLQQEIERLQSEPDRKMHSWVNDLMMETILEREDAGLYWLLDFPGASYLNMQFMDMHPLLPSTYHERIRRIIGDVGGNEEVTVLFGSERQPLPLEESTPFAVLNDLIPKWTFFTRQEIRAIQPSVLAFTETTQDTYWYKEEWQALLTAHERYDYDWLAFYYMF
ncbi:MAG: hypothetical protein R2867_29800 [Caldilineaceae bacterium]